MREEEDVRRLLGRAGADEGPPLRIDADTVLRQGRRIRTRRRGMVVLGSSLATVAAVVVTALLIGHADREPRIQPATGDTPPTPVTTVTLAHLPPTTPNTWGTTPLGTTTDGSTTVGPTRTTLPNTTTHH